MDPAEFRQRAHALVDWMADYLEHVETQPVTPRVVPGTIVKKIPALPPDASESFDAIMHDFSTIILPGMTHWQHPAFFGYFPANSSPPSVLAEMVTATMGAQCMSWATSPAATELEERMMQWLAQMIGLPAGFTGVIQDTASTATLCSILTARETATGYAINDHGFPAGPALYAYCSLETHSSIEKGLKIAGIGKTHLRKIDVDRAFAMDPQVLEHTIEQDLRSGGKPFYVAAALGTTGSTAIDPLRRIGEICRKHGLWLHVDAAFAGSACLAPEYRWMLDGVELADSFVFNPHKWMFTNFDCSAYFVKDVAALVRTFEILPEYLKTPEHERVSNYRDWGLQLGRRFRALKLWFVIRSFGVNGLRDHIRNHIHLAHALVEKMRAAGDFELLAPVPLNLICFRYRPPGLSDRAALEQLNATLLDRLNASGKLFLTHTRLNGVFTLRMVIGQTAVRQDHVDAAWELIRQTAHSLPVA